MLSYLALLLPSSQPKPTPARRRHRPFEMVPAMENVRLPRTHLTLRTRLGHGTFGVVYSATNEKTLTSCAIKVVHKKASHQNEVKLHAIVQSHPNIVSLYHSHEIDQFVAMEMKLCGGGSLYEYELTMCPYWRNTPLSRGHSLQLVNAVMFCHSKGIYHCDIKPQ
jgi:serine/threonine protein kinase